MAKAQPGSIDWSFDMDFNFANRDQLNTIAIQEDGRIIVGGKFTIPLFFRDSPQNILRLEKNGGFDTTFKIGTGFDDKVNFILIQPDEKILVGGDFKSFNGEKCQSIIRLNKEGSIDTSFNPPVIDKFVAKIALQSNSKIIIGGQHLLKRLNNDGSIDTNFKFINNGIYLYFIGSICQQLDGKILIGGYFPPNHTDLYTRRVFFRINDNGSLDNFDPGKNIELIGAVRSMLIQKDGKILIGGSGIDSKKNNKITDIVRFNSDGNWDSTFNLATGFEKDIGSYKHVNSVVMQNDEKIIIGGRFDKYDEEMNRNIVRLNTNAGFDSSFKTGSGFDGEVFCLAQQGEEKIIVAGNFKSFDFNSTNRIVRLSIKDELPLKFFIFPNPTFGNFKIKSSQSLNLITITDAVGKEILRITPMAFDAEIDLSDKSQGVYFVTVFSDGGSKCQKILKQ